MRRIHQKMLLELVGTLDEAHAVMKRLVGSNSQAIFGLLSSSMDCAEAMAQVIRQFEGRETSAVYHIEEYCRLLKQATQQMNSSGRMGRLIKNLRDQQKKIEHTIKTELRPNKIEMVFLPYKASMWDSMESVWLAANNDPQCDALVVPIPYFDRRPDGTMERMHYEGKDYPDYVPIVDWRSLNLEERHPDVIFIHNPYDGNNYVTSVHPDYYSQRLKDYTDILAYIPYFVSSEVTVADHLAVCPATLFAGKVFVQSESIRLSYMAAFRRFEERNQSAGRFGIAAEKFVALGSPKFDEAFKATQRGFALPDEWEKRIRTPKGKKKQIVLYNTSIGALLQGDAQYLKKLRHVLDTFKASDEAVLWWRPHPLNEATYQSMRPHLKEDYESIVREYRSAGYGIYDDTADPYRAISASSCYYGDHSSLVALYQCTGKPVMLQDVGLSGQANARSSLSFRNLYDDGGAFWFTAIELNALFKMDKDSWKAECKGTFPEESVDARELFSCMTRVGNKLYCAPFLASSITVFDVDTEAFTSIKLNEAALRLDFPDKAARPLFSSIAKHGSCLYFIPYTYPSIVCYDTNTGTLTYHDDWLEPVMEIVTKPNFGYFCESRMEGDTLILPCFNANAAVLFDMNNRKSSLCKFDEGVGCFRSFDYDGRAYWMVTHGGQIYRWACPDNKLDTIDMPPFEVLSQHEAFRAIRYAHETVWAFPSYADKAIRVDTQSRRADIAEEFQGACAKGENDYLQSYLLAIAEGDHLYAHTGRTNRFIELDTATGTIREESISFIMSSPAAKNLHSRLIFRKSEHFVHASDFSIQERDFLTIVDLVALLQTEEYKEDFDDFGQKQLAARKKEIAGSDGEAGEAIYVHCRKALRFEPQVNRAIVN